MKITKFGHCCMLVETNGVRILTDPGTFTTAQDEQKNIDLLLITHEHADHYHIDSVKKILANNPNITIVTNTAVGAILDKEGIKHQIVGDGQSMNFKNILIEGFGTKHAVIYGEFGQVENTGFLVDGKLYYPGDAFTIPGKPVEVLAVPAGGPWMKISEAIDFAKTIKPKKAFPVHDAMYIPQANFGARVLEMFLAQDQIQVIHIELNKETEF